MKREEIFNKLRNIIADILGVDKSSITEDSLLESELGADSLDAVDMIMDAEHVFGITIPLDEELPDHDKATMRDFVDIVEKYRSLTPNPSRRERGVNR